LKWQKKVEDKPSLIKIKTIIAYGSQNQGSEKTHGAPLGIDDVKSVKSKFGFDPNEDFCIPSDVKDYFRNKCEERKVKENVWNEIFEKYKNAFPNEAAELVRRIEKKLPLDWKSKLPTFTANDGGKATRVHSGNVLNEIAEIMPEIIGGSADLTPSNNTKLKCSDDFQFSSPQGRYIRFGVREHAMIAICNGIFAYGGMRPFAATFLNFISYGIGAVRLSALSKFGVIFIMTHDSIGLGEDGPTHQPIETLEALRSLPGMNVFRPADGNETTGAYICAVESVDAPTVLALTRQSLPNLEGSSVEGVAKGAYVLSEHGPSDRSNLSLVIIGTGSEVSLVVEVGKVLGKSGKKVRIVSMPNQKLFDGQSGEYKAEVFPEGVPIMAVEAAAENGWHKYAHAVYGMRSYGASGAGNEMFEKFGFTIENLVGQAEKVIEFYGKVKAPSMVRPVLLH